MCFPVNIAKFLRATILKNIYEQLFLSIVLVNISTAMHKLAQTLLIAICIAYCKTEFQLNIRMKCHCPAKSGCVDKAFIIPKAPVEVTFFLARF